MTDKGPDAGNLASRTAACDRTGEEVHISSLFVQARPDALAQVVQSIEEMSQVTVHLTSEEGKLVVSLETENLLQVTNYIDQINALPAVVSASLVYHQCEQADALDEIVDVDPQARLIGKADEVAQ